MQSAVSGPPILNEEIRRRFLTAAEGVEGAVAAPDVDGLADDDRGGVDGTVRDELPLLFSCRGIDGVDGPVEAADDDDAAHDTRR